MDQNILKPSPPLGRRLTRPRLNLKIEKIKIPVANSRNTRLERSAQVKLVVNGEEQELTVSYDELIFVCELGRGGFGTVYYTIHTPSSFPFAVKQIDDGRLGYSGDRIRSKDIEMGFKIGTKSPYLTKFYGALHAQASTWILTELMDACLDSFCVKYKKLNPGTLLPESFMSKVAYSVLKGLSFMKQLKLIHRDVKPSNILLNLNGDIKLCDFGITGTTINSYCHTFIGCQIYMAPEKIIPQEDGFSIKSDIWSLGISMIEIASGSNPFRNMSYAELLNQATHGESPILDPSLFSPELCRFVDLCLIKSPEKRPSCQELLKEDFILKYEKESPDLEFYKSIIDQIKSEL